LVCSDCSKGCPLKAKNVLKDNTAKILKLKYRSIHLYVYGTSQLSHMQNRVGSLLQGK